MSRVLPAPLASAALAVARHAAKALDAAQPAGVRADGPLMIVPMGDLGHVYSQLSPEPMTEQEVRERHPGLLERCVHSPAIGLTLVRSNEGPIALRGDLRWRLDRPDEAAALDRVMQYPLFSTYARDLLRLRSSGDVVLVGVGAPCGDTVAFPWEFGSHGGLSEEELETFVIHPAPLGQDAFAHVLRPQQLHTFFEERSGRSASQPDAAVGT
jgi:hypothetical protein